MSSLFFALILLLFASSFISSSLAYNFYVGGKNGWVPNPSEDYNLWAGRNRFKVNDTLTFKMKEGTDSVLVVKKEDYYNCNTKNPIKVLSSGGTSTFQLDRSGPFFFISANQQNCQKGQKLIVVVLAIRPKPAPVTPSPLPPSQSPSTPPKTPSPAGSPVSTPPSTTPNVPSPTSPVMPPAIPTGPAVSPSTAPSPNGKTPVVPAPVPSTSGPSPSSSVSPTPTSSSPATSPSPSSTVTSPPAPSPASTTTSPPAPSPGALPANSPQAAGTGTATPPGAGETAAGNSTSPPGSVAWTVTPSKIVSLGGCVAISVVLLF